MQEIDMTFQLHYSKLYRTNEEIYTTSGKCCLTWVMRSQISLPTLSQKLAKCLTLQNLTANCQENQY